MLTDSGLLTTLCDVRYLLQFHADLHVKDFERKLCKTIDQYITIVNTLP